MSRLLFGTLFAIAVVTTAAQPPAGSATERAAIGRAIHSVAGFGARARPEDAPGHQAASETMAVLRAFERAAARPVWPDFRLSDWPIAVFDGTDTLLLRHPQPPAEFKPLPDLTGVFAVAGRHPSVAGNSTVELAGVRTATVVVGGPQASASALLAYVEELFHLFWRHRHAAFRPNEMARYAYPIDDRRIVERLFGESEALARALDADCPQQAAAWAAAAAGIRRQRRARLAEEDRAFETGLEMMEGTANYVARSATGEAQAATSTRLRASRPIDQVRWRYYDSGAAICLLLDRFEPNWKRRIDAEPELTTADLLEAAVERTGARPASFSAAETARIEGQAAAAVADLSARRVRLGEELRTRTGTRVVIEVPEGADPLRLVRFDPINLFVLDAGAVAHPRYLTLSTPDGTIEVTNPGYARDSFGGTVAVTRPAGRHPLEQGIRAVTIVGVSGAPKVDRREDRLTIDADGIHISLRHAEARAEDGTVRVDLRPRR